MKLAHYTDIPLEEVNVDGAKNTKIRWLISQKDNAPHFAMRMFEVEPGGFTPYHTHEWEHEAFVLQGKGALVTKDDEKEFKQWDVIFVPPNVTHQFRNTGDDLMRFLCIIPHPEQLKKPEKKKKANPLKGKTVSTC